MGEEVVMKQVLWGALAALFGAFPVALADESAEAVVQRQFDAYNAHDLDTFASTLAETVQVYRLPTMELAMDGREATRARFGTLFEEVEPQCALKARLVEGPYVADQEDCRFAEDRVTAIALYQVADGLIRRFWLGRGEAAARPDDRSADLETLITRHLDALHARDLEALEATIAEDIAVHWLPETGPRYEGRPTTMDWYRQVFKDFDPRCTLRTRIIEPPFIVDHDTCLLGGTPTSAIVIYETKDDRIRGIWFAEPSAAIE